MTIQQPIRKLAAPLLCAAVALVMAGCSSEDSPSGTGGAAGSAGSPGSSGSSAGGSGSSAGSSSAGSSSAGTGSVIPGDSSQIVGTFAVQMKVDKLMTSVVGKVADGPVPINLVWTEKKTEGNCRLETPTSPFCEDPCGADVCVADGKCQPYPTGHSVGEVTLTGVHVAGGGTEVVLKEIAASYQPPAGTALAYPPFGASDTIEVHATGKDYAAFDLSTKGVDPIALSTEDFDLDPAKPFVLAWDAAADPKASQIHVKIDLSHHGGVKGLIECDLDDTGSLTISKEMIAELIGLGVAGYPSVVVTRTSLDTAQLDHGRVELEVSSLVERYLTTPGVVSCTTDEDCSDGKTCRSSDSTCQ
jgi:hypothetical protein